jgi:hypothetical protein
VGLTQIGGEMPETTVDPKTSILVGLKKALGIDAVYDAFDPDIIMFANGVFSTLNQLGVGPTEGFELEDDSATWDQYFGDTKVMNGVKTYLYLKVRMIFDPPPANVMASMERQASEFEWRLMVAADPKFIDPTEASDDDA